MSTAASTATLASAAGSSVRLGKVLSVWSIAAYTVCGIIGSGIFISPKGVLQHAGSTGMALVMWAVTGVINILGALCYAELALTHPQTGSDYLYIDEGFGDLASFLFMWVNFLFADSAGRAVVALTFATYLCGMVWPACSPPETPKRLVATLALTAITAAQIYSTKVAVHTSNFFTAAKMIGLCVIMASGLAWVCLGHTENLSSMMEGSSSNPGSYTLAFYSAYWAYSGVNGAMTVIEEVHEPLTRNILVSVSMAMVAVTVTYILTNLAYVIVLPADDILASEAVAMTFGDRIFSGLFWLMPFFVACSTFGAMNNSILGASRINLAATRKGHLPSWLGLISYKYLTLAPSLVVNLALSIILLCTNVLYSLLLYATYVNVIGTAASILALIINRFRRPELARPFRLPLVVPMVFFVILLVLIGYPLYEVPFETGLCFVLMATGVPVYFLFVRTDTRFAQALRPAWVSAVDAGLTRFVQKLFLVIPEEAAEGEGNNNLKQS